MPGSRADGMWSADGMSPKLWCFLGVHKYLTINTHPLMDSGSRIGTYYVLRCQECGKHSGQKIRT